MDTYRQIVQNYYHILYQEDFVIEYVIVIKLENLVQEVILKVLLYN